MKKTYAFAVLAIAAITALSVGIASAQGPVQSIGQMMGDTGMHNMMRGMHASNMMQGGFAHNKEDINQMREEMKEHHADLTEEEMNKMMENCPMMRTA